ncbi:hypothetical protein K491DRAFT_697685 [Lophiostoma macrostomum CBS 122681]|uniref:Cupin type-1 domain-containing protein n=1 Tax=Lophiostoma macrostomum CBS 122681 TaxID=1314788 RepID=A0A6A6SQ42_9PLEO|nr:hypothetical protein K491DRAFT_697685 [Lophiostoma macrostomum CBS 122681]
MGAMHIPTVILLTFLTGLDLVGALAMASPNPSQNDPKPRYFNVTAISASEGKSTIECWQFLEPIVQATDAGIAGTAIQRLGDVSNTTSLVALPPKFDGGKHRAPAAQLVVFLSGLARVTIPDSEDEAWIQGGKNGIIIAADTADVSDEGHITQYPSNETTTALQIPFKDGKIPAHKVLYKGPCKKSDMVF